MKRKPNKPRRAKPKPLPLKIDCPSCGSPSRVSYGRKKAAGTIVRVHVCKSCGKRFRSTQTVDGQKYFDISKHLSEPYRFPIPELQTSVTLKPSETSHDRRDPQDGN